MLTRTKALAAAVALAGGGSLLAAAPAVAYYSPPLIMVAEPQSPARLVAGGAAIDVTVEYSCTATAGMSLSLDVAQRVGRKVATGQAYDYVSCNRRTQKTVLRVKSDGTAFGRGNAAVTTEISGCYSTDYWWSTCGDDQMDDIIRVKK
jgi:hypothetical protein